MKKKILIGISIIFATILLIAGSIVLVRYFKYKDFFGTYKLVEGENLDKLKLNLYDWTIGNKEDLECDLWNCDGYEHGNKYIVKGEKIYFYFDSHGVIIHNYELKKNDGNIYLILRSDNSEVTYKKE